MVLAGLHYSLVSGGRARVYMQTLLLGTMNHHETMQHQHGHLHWISEGQCRAADTTIASQLQVTIPNVVAAHLELSLVLVEDLLPVGMGDCLIPPITAKALLHLAIP